MICAYVGQAEEAVKIGPPLADLDDLVLGDPAFEGDTADRTRDGPLEELPGVSGLHHEHLGPFDLAALELDQGFVRVLETIGLDRRFDRNRRGDGQKLQEVPAGDVGH